MAKPMHLFKRGVTYYYRRRVPKDLVTHFKKQEIRESLKTIKYEEAKKLCAERTVYWDALFAHATDLKKSETNSNKSLKPLSQTAAIKLVQDYVKHMDDKWRLGHAKDGPGTAEERREMLKEMQFSQQVLSDPGDPDRERDVFLTSKNILTGTDFKIGEGGISYPELAEFVRRGLLELYRRDAARLSDDHSKSYFDHLFSNDGSAKATATMAFGDLCAEYFSEYSKGAKFKGIAQQRVDTVKRYLELVEEMVGSETSVGDLDYDHCVAFRDTLAKVPTNRHKIYGDMPIEKVVAAAEKDNRPTMSYVTQKGYLGTLTLVLKLAVKKNLLLSVPSADLRRGGRFFDEPLLEQ